MKARWCVLSRSRSTPANTGARLGFARTPPASAAGSLSMLGADVSSVQRALDLGARYYDASGTARDPLDILTSIGVNYVRLRIWNNPASGYNNKSAVLAYAKTVKAK